MSRLAWLGKVVLCPLDAEDADCRSWLLHMQPLEELAAEVIRVNGDLNGMPFASQIHILHAEQGAALSATFREGMEMRARDPDTLSRRDFHFETLFRRSDGRTND